jgi:threonine synthase
MTDYISTRGGEAVSLSEALFRGLAPDGGLYVPVSLPDVGSQGRDTGYAAGLAPVFRDTAHRYAGQLLKGCDAAHVGRVVDRAVTFPVPLVEVEKNRFVLELFHGPTHAFKDVGARFMAAMMQELAGEASSSRTVLVATSGDTGGAVANACEGLSGVRVVLLFPAGRVSRRQRLQMTTLGSNVHAVEVAGSFDDCQWLVKAAFADEGLRTRSSLTSANSINIARLLPQALYYLHAVECLGAERPELRPPHFVVPSGNLGNLCAGLIAGLAGMPHSGFTCAVNANSGFADYLAGADFEARPSRRTTSSAMDVGAPSNLERIRWFYDGDDGAVRDAVRGASVSDQVVEGTIRDLYHRTGYVVDPHTAVAYSAAMQSSLDDAPVVVLSTAHPAKFPETVERATGHSIDLPPGLRFEDDVVETFLQIEPKLAALRDLLVSTPS